MILKKLNDNHYVILADEKTLSNNGDWYLSHPDYNKAVQWNMPLNTQHEDKQVWINKILYSTQPLEEMNHGNYKSKVFLDIEQLSLSEVEELINGYSVEKMAEEAAIEMEYDYDSLEDNGVNHFIDGYIKGFNAHKELVKDKLFTVEDMKKIIHWASLDEDVRLSEDEFIQSLLPKTEWQCTIRYIFQKQKTMKLINHANNKPIFYNRK